MQHYCRGCASLRQRGYKKSLTLRDLRHAMHVQGNAPPGRDFLDVAVRIKAATMALPTLPEARAVESSGGRRSATGGQEEGAVATGAQGQKTQTGFPALVPMDSSEKIATEVLAGLQHVRSCTLTCSGCKLRSLV
jgi:hypothetical protein